MDLNRHVRKAPRRGHAELDLDRIRRGVKERRRITHASSRSLGAKLGRLRAMGVTKGVRRLKPSADAPPAA